MDARELETMLRLERTFMPYASGRREEMQKEGRRFVHYTSAENAIRIIQSKQIWMRNAKCMTDYMEILHGHQLLVQFFSQPEKRDSFYQALNGCHDGIGEEAIKLFDEWWANIQFNTYIGCISEHEESENQHGRLSMWRAFGRLPARAAIVLKVPPPGDTEGLHVALSPVAYFDYPKVEQQILAVINNIKENSEFLQSLNLKILNFCNHSIRTVFGIPCSIRC